VGQKTTNVAYFVPGGTVQKQRYMEDIGGVLGANYRVQGMSKNDRIRRLQKNRKNLFQLQELQRESKINRPISTKWTKNIDTWILML